MSTKVHNKCFDRRIIVFWIFAFFSVGAWFSGFAVYGKVTFSSEGNHLLSFSIILLSILPGLIFSQVISRILGRYPPMKVAQWAILSSAISVLGMILADSAFVLLFVFSQALAHRFVTPMRNLVIRSAFESHEIDSAVRTMGKIQTVATIVAPPLAGILIGLWGVNAALSIDLLLCAFTIGLIGKAGDYFEFNYSHTTKRKIEPIVLGEMRRLWLLLSIPAGSIFIIMIYDLVYPVYIRDTHVGGIEEFGVILALISLGAFLGTFKMSAKLAPYQASLMLTLAALGLIINPSYTAYFSILATTAFLTGFAQAFLVIQCNMKIQRDPLFCVATSVALENSVLLGQLLAVLLTSVCFIAGNRYGYISVVLIISGLLVAITAYFNLPKETA